MDKLTSWGGVTVPGTERLSEDLEHITAGASLSRGLGRSYGDSSLPASSGLAVAGTVLADRTGRTTIEQAVLAPTCAG
jgi:hypothetical protein